jgi:hypothetical protein
MMEWYSMDCSDSGYDQCRALVNTVMNFGVHKILGSSRVAAQLKALRGGLNIMELVNT